MKKFRLTLNYRNELTDRLTGLRIKQSNVYISYDTHAEAMELCQLICKGGNILTVDLTETLDGEPLTFHNEK